jgi:hypothetical protein
MTIFSKLLLNVWVQLRKHARFENPNPDPRGRKKWQARHFPEKAVLGIRDILVRIRIRIREAKNIQIQVPNGTFTTFFKNKKSEISYKTAEIKVFLTIFA